MGGLEGRSLPQFLRFCSGSSKLVWEQSAQMSHLEERIPANGLMSLRPRPSGQELFLLPSMSTLHSLHSLIPHAQVLKASAGSQNKLVLQPECAN